MVRAFPLGRDAFWGQIPAWAISFELAEAMEVSGLGDGSMLTDAIGPRLWRGKVEIDLLPASDGRRIEALISLLRGPGRSFLAWRPDCATPRSDPEGSQLSGHAPTIHSLPADARELALANLPPGYQVSPGDMLSFTYGSDPTRQALHQVVSDPVTASGAGITPLIEVMPPIRPGASIGAAVDLVRPCCKAILLPGSTTPGTLRRDKLRDLSFGFIQTLR